MPSSVRKDIPYDYGASFTATIARLVFCDTCLGKCEPCDVRVDVRSGSIYTTSYAVNSNDARNCPVQCGTVAEGFAPPTPDRRKPQTDHRRPLTRRRPYAEANLLIIRAKFYRSVRLE